MKKITVSKMLLLAVMVTYFVGLIIGIYFVYKTITDSPEHSAAALTAMFGYIGAPVAVTIGFYSWKAKHENVAKITKSDLEDEEE